MDNIGYVMKVATDLEAILITNINIAILRDVVKSYGNSMVA